MDWIMYTNNNSQTVVGEIKLIFGSKLYVFTSVLGKSTNFDASTFISDYAFKLSKINDGQLQVFH